jgi:hypothetical protein
MVFLDKAAAGDARKGRPLRPIGASNAPFSA